MTYREKFVNIPAKYLGTATEVDYEMEKSMSKHGKILLYFFLGIGLPGLLLGYLALRGIQNDQALLERERMNEHRAIARQIAESIDEDILEVEQAFRDPIANYQESQRSDLLRSLDSLKKQHTFIEGIFLLEGSGRIQLPLAGLLFLPDGSAQLPSAQLPPASLRKVVQTGQQYEFQQGNYEKALASYQQAFARADYDAVKAELLNAIARVQRKSDLFPDAVESYRRIIQGHSHARMGSGMPWGLAARLELGALFLTVGDPANAVGTFIDLYQALVRREWTLERSQYEFAAQKAKESTDKILSGDALSASVQSYHSAFRVLTDEEKKQRQITERLLTFRENAASGLLAVVSSNTEKPQEMPERSTLELGRRTYLVSILGDRKGNGDQNDETWGLLFNSEGLKANLLQPVIQQHVPRVIHWTVYGKNGEAILNSDDSASGTVTVKSDFAESFPPWSLEFRQEDPRFLEILTSWRGVYLYMLILLAGILIFGLTLTIRIVTQELELGRMKSDFVSTVSHEFKSPLTAIRQLAEMLQEGRVPSEERREQYYDVLVEQSQRLSLLIDNILDFARIDDGGKEFEFETVDVVALLEEIVSTFQHGVRHEGFTIQIEINESLPLIQADRGAITQTIANLMDNAVKYSGEAREIYVRAFTEGQHLVISVQDLGIGIKREEIDKVFDRFYRGGDELTRAVKGSGLGLTLVKQIVEAHHGTVHVESEPGRGSTFSIRLPLAEE